MSSREQPNQDKKLLDRREVVALGAGIAALTTAGCGTSTSVASKVADLVGTNAATAASLLAGIDTVVVLMMENRSFDHYFGEIKKDATYPAANVVAALSGNESNLNSQGQPVASYHLPTLTQADPPHSWEACHAQWNNGRNDGFVTQNAGANENEVMGYYTRNELPFLYWLADNFTLCDQWHAGVLGPTWPNRAVLHATTAKGLKKNRPYLISPRTIWDELRSIGVEGKNYHAGSTAIYSGLYLEKVIAGVNPTAKIDEFFAAAAAGTLPPFVMIDPDFESNDDHPSHNVHLGQAMISSIYHALAASPQWDKCLFIVTYDEHGGFYDHVAPPQCADADPDYTTLGFRVPSVVIGPTVRRGAVCSTSFEHSSVAATLKTRFGIDDLTPRMAAANDLSACIDPDALNNPRQPPAGAPVIDLGSLAEVLLSPREHGQPELRAMETAGHIPQEARDNRSRDERLAAWVKTAQALGAVKLR